MGLQKKLEDLKNHNLLRNNLDYIKEQLVKEENFVRKELEKQNLKEILEKVNQKVDKLLEQIVKKAR